MGEGDWEVILPHWEQVMCTCENCQLERIDPKLYKLKMDWLGHAQSEEFHQKNPQGNSYMFGYHKEERLRLEEKMRKYKRMG